MTKRLLVLMLGAVAVSGWLYVIRFGKSRAFAKIKDGHHVDSPIPARQVRSIRLSPTAHAAILVVATVALGVAAYLGLAGGGHASAGTPAGPSLDPNISLQQDASLHGSYADELSADTNSAQPQIATPWEADLQPAKQIVRTAENAPIQLPKDGFEAMICAKAWPCAEAISVASCESGLDRHGRLDGNWARNGNNYGLFQINSVHANIWPDFYQDWMDPLKNTEWAFEIWSKSGWGPWECQPGGSSSKKVANYASNPSPAEIVPNDTPVPEPTATPATDSPTPRPTRSVHPTPTLPAPEPTR